MDILKYISSSKKSNFFLFAGPCVIEGETMAIQIAEILMDIAVKYDIPFVFKGSYRKANRSRVDSFTGIGDEKALKILKKIKDFLGIPVVTDIHSALEAEIAAQYVDILQIPAFLCRQTDILIAASNTGKFINIKKGQFLSPESMKYACDKIRHSNGSNFAVTERGSFFGYGDLVVDFRSIPIMKSECKCPVILDVTHSLQQPNTSTGITGGRPELISTISRAGIAVGADGIFLETHPDPKTAKSDGANMIALDLVEPLLKNLTNLRMTVNQLDD